MVQLTLQKKPRVIKKRREIHANFLPIHQPFAATVLLKKEFRAIFLPNYGALSFQVVLLKGYQRDRASES